MIKAEWKTGDNDLSDARRLRHEVFTLEQGVPPEIEADGRDGGAIHVLLYEDGRPVATGRMIAEGDHAVMGRIAVLKEHRGQGLGGFVVRLLIRRAFEAGARRQLVHSQSQVAAFYESLGFKRMGREYIEAGMPHIDMERFGDIEGNC